MKMRKENKFGIGSSYTINLIITPRQSIIETEEVPNFRNGRGASKKPLLNYLSSHIYIYNRAKEVPNKFDDIYQIYLSPITIAA